MAHSHIRTVSGIALGAAVAMAYVQVSGMPAAAAMTAPALDRIVSHVASEVAWLRTEIPRSSDWWIGVGHQSSGDLRVLVDLLTVAGHPTR